MAWSKKKMREYQKEWRKNHPNYLKEWRESNPNYYRERLGKSPFVKMTGDEKKEKRRQYYQRYRDKILSYSKEYYLNNKERARLYCIENRDKINKRRRGEKYRISANRARQKYREVHPDRQKAHYLFAKAIKKGQLIQQPCEVCGTLNNIHGHHDNYDKPLVIRWLCKLHHIELHKKLRNGENS